MDVRAGGETATLDPQAWLVVGTNASAAMIGHAVSGLGLCIAFRNWMKPHFATGVLIPVLQDWRPEFGGPHLYSHGHRPPAPVRAFVDMVGERRVIDVFSFLLRAV